MRNSKGMTIDVHDVVRQMQDSSLRQLRIQRELTDPSLAELRLRLQRVARFRRVGIRINRVDDHTLVVSPIPDPPTWQQVQRAMNIPPAF